MTFLLTFVVGFVGCFVGAHLGGAFQDWFYGREQRKRIDALEESARRWQAAAQRYHDAAVRMYEQACEETEMHWPN